MELTYMTQSRQYRNLAEKSGLFCFGLEDSFVPATSRSHCVLLSFLEADDLTCDLSGSGELLRQIHFTILPRSEETILNTISIIEILEINQCEQARTVES